MKILIAATLLPDDAFVRVADDGTVPVAGVPLTWTVLCSPDYQGGERLTTVRAGAEDLAGELREKLFLAAEAMRPGDACVQVGLGKLPTVRCPLPGLTPPEAARIPGEGLPDGMLTMDERMRTLAASNLRAAAGRKAEAVPELVAALAWYREQARLCRLVHSEGDAGRNALAADGGKRASDVLAKLCREIHGKALPAEPLNPSKADCEDLIRAGHMPGRVFIPEGFTRDTLVRTLVAARERFVERTQRDPEVIVMYKPHFLEMAKWYGEGGDRPEELLYASLRVRYSPDVTAEQGFILV